MTKRADLVMPKLGLTMIEGMVARWAIPPGASFSAGDIIAVVETDKIAFDVEAPGTGRLAEILVPAGEAVAVGTPIARWLPSGGEPVALFAGAIASEPAAPAAVPPVTAPAISARGDRIIATPYARRLAREAVLDLATVTASNGHRIKAADVAAAIVHNAGARSGKAREAPLAGMPSAASAPSAGFAFYGAEVCVERLQRLIGEIDIGTPELRPSLIHFVALAAARTIAGTGGTVGLQHDDHAPRRLSPHATRRLSTIVSADRAGTETTEGPITVVVSNAAGATLVGRTPVGCDAVLGVGAIEHVFRPDASDSPALRAEISLLLTVSNAATLPDAVSLLGHVRALLENPLSLLAV
jgi:pyruvate dehydrogenase E2 component (dihydrolipoyllysine-residue acetyltransferase)